MKETVIRFKGEEYLLIGNTQQGGAICIREQFKNGECNFAQLEADGLIRRFNMVIGSLSDLEIIGEEEAEVSNEGMENLLSGKGWPRDPSHLRKLATALRVATQKRIEKSRATND